MIKIRDCLSYLDRCSIQYSFYGNADTVIEGFSSLNNYKDNTMTWLKSSNLDIPKNIDNMILVIGDNEADFHAKNKILVGNPKQIFFTLVDAFYGKQNSLKPIGDNTVISGNVKIGKDVIIGSNTTISGDIVIGDNTSIGDNVVIVNNVNIGKYCVIQSGVTIGHDGFGYYKNECGNLKMIRHYGGVEIADDVFIGCNTNIARGTIDDTIIGSGSRIDALCHIAHNVKIGSEVTVVAGSTIYGSATIDDKAYLATSIIRNQIKIGEEAFVGMGSVVVKNVDKKDLVIGVPANKLDNK